MSEDIAVPVGERPEPRSGMRQWKCLTCQFRLASELLPYRCPRCGASRVKMQELSQKDEVTVEE